MNENEEQIICLYMHIQVCKNQIYVKYIGSLLYSIVAMGLKVYYFLHCTSCELT